MRTEASSLTGQSGSRFWHPFLDMATVESAELVISRAEEVWLGDDAGNWYLDGTASLWYANIDMVDRRWPKRSRSKYRS